jgi:hypothetical protein
MIWQNSRYQQEESINHSWGCGSDSFWQKKEEWDRPIFDKRQKSDRFYHRSPSSYYDKDKSYSPKSYPQQFVPRKSPNISRRIGKRVFHETFGFGTVIREEGNRLEVHFDDHGLKKVMSSFLSEA